MEIYPVLIEGTVICRVKRCCQGALKECESCQSLVIYLHNWLRHTQIPYAIFDLQEEATLCPFFMSELGVLRKKVRTPFLFCGTRMKTQALLEAHHLLHPFPFWHSPEEALQQMRLKYPEVGETSPFEFVHFDHPLSQTWNIVKTGINPLFAP
jgi:hypothetical protein